MTEAKRIMTMDDFEHRLLVGCINKARTEYMEEGLLQLRRFHER